MSITSPEAAQSPGYPTGESLAITLNNIFRCFDYIADHCRCGRFSSRSSSVEKLFTDHISSKINPVEHAVHLAKRVMLGNHCRVKACLNRVSRDR